MTLLILNYLCLPGLATVLQQFLFYQPLSHVYCCQVVKSQITIMVNFPLIFENRNGSRMTSSIQILDTQPKIRCGRTWKSWTEMENGMCLEKEVRIFEFSIFIPRNKIIIRSCVGGYVSLLHTVFIVVNLHSTFSVDISTSVTNQSLFVSSCCIISVTLLLFANLSSKPR